MFNRIWLKKPCVRQDVAEDHAQEVLDIYKGKK